MHQNEFVGWLLGGGLCGVVRCGVVGSVCVRCGVVMCCVLYCVCVCECSAVCVCECGVRVCVRVCV